MKKFNKATKIIALIMAVLVLAAALAACKGTNGAKGDKGDPGAAGAAGAQGPKGETGAAGAAGAQGEQGPQGNAGAQGPQGPQGNTGTAGAQGAQGPQGETGDAGAAGKDGLDGATWLSGTDVPDNGAGVNGDFYLNLSTYTVYHKEGGAWINYGVIKGDTGLKGEIGDTGAKGADGNIGVDGKSAYELYKAAYPLYDKSETEWLDDLVNGRLATRAEHMTVWKYDDGRLFDITLTANGNVPAHAAPVKENTDTVEYTFTGWSPAPSEATKDAVYTATFSQKTRLYTVEFISATGTKTTQYQYGANPYSAPGTKPGDGNAAYYVFSRWSPSFAPVTENTIYTALYEASTQYLSFSELGDGSGYRVNGSGLQTTATDIIIPSYYNDKPVKEFAVQAFINKANIQTVTIPKTLVNLNFDQNVFQGCDGLTQFTVDPENPNYKSVDGVLFSKDGKQLIRYPAKKADSSYTVPSGVERIERQAFMNAKTLTAVSFPNTLTTIANQAFNGAGLTGTLTLPDSLTTLTDTAHFQGTKIEHLIIGTGLTHMTSTNSFSGITTLQTVTINSDLKSIGYGMFQGCTGLTTFNTPNINTTGDGTGEIGGYAFSGCNRLQSITLPSVITSIGTWAFGSCSVLTSIVIPDTVVTVGERAFSSCSSLTINCRIGILPSGWHANWNSSSRPVNWGYTG